MFTRFAAPLARTAATRLASARPAVAATGRSNFATLQDAGLTANDAARVSGYSEIDYLINEDAPVIEAVQKFAAYNIGCLVTTDKDGTYIFFFNLPFAIVDFAWIGLFRLYFLKKVIYIYELPFSIMKEKIQKLRKKCDYIFAHLLFLLASFFPTSFAPV